MPPDEASIVAEARAIVEAYSELGWFSGSVLVGVTEHHGPDGGIEATPADVLAFYRALFHSDALLASDYSASNYGVDVFWFRGTL